MSPAALHQWGFLLQLIGFFFWWMCSVGFSSAGCSQWVFLLQLSGFFFCHSVGFSSAAHWGFLLLQLSGVFFCRICSVGFSSAAHWDFLKDVLSGFFFCLSVGFSSAGCTPWVYALWPKQSFVDFGESWEQLQGTLQGMLMLLCKLGSCLPWRCLKCPAQCFQVLLIDVHGAA